MGAEDYWSNLPKFDDKPQEPGKPQESSSEEVQESPKPKEKSEDYWSGLPKVVKPQPPPKPQEPSEEKQKGIAVPVKVSPLKIFSCFLAGIIFLFFVGIGGAFAYFRSHPTTFLNLPDPVLKPIVKTLSSIPIFRSPGILVLNSLINLESLESFEQETDARFNLLSKTNKDLGSIIFKVSSPVKVNPEEGKRVDSEAKVLLEINYEEYRKQASTELDQTVFEGASALLPESPVIIAGELRFVAGDLFILPKKLPQIELINFAPLLNKWWVQKDAKLSFQERVEYTEEEEEKFEEEIIKLVTKIKYEKHPDESEGEREFYKIKVVIKKAGLKEFLVNIPEAGEDFYESQSEKEKNAQEVIDALGNKAEPNFSFLYYIDKKHKLPGKLVFEGEFSELEGFGEALLRPANEQLNVLGTETPGAALIPKPTQLLPATVRYSVTATLKDYNKPVFVQIPLEAKPVEEIPWEEVLFPFQTFMLRYMEEVYGPLLEEGELEQ